MSLAETEIEIEDALSSYKSGSILVFPDIRQEDGKKQTDKTQMLCQYSKK